MLKKHVFLFSFTKNKMILLLLAPLSNLLFIIDYLLLSLGAD